MVGFRLLKLTNLVSRPFFNKFANEHSLSLTEWRTIVVLADRPGSAAQDIALATGLQPMNISRAVIKLRKSGLIEEARDPQNHRRILLWLTSQGAATFRAIAPSSENHAAQLLGVLNDNELRQLGDLVDKLILRAEELGESIDPDSD